MAKIKWIFFDIVFPPRCSFILRRVGQVSSFSGDGVGSQKKKLKKVIFRNCVD